MKILIIRFSSIGDIVLTTPIIRAIYTQIPNAEIHYLTKESFISLLKPNPYIHTIHTYKEGNFWRMMANLRRENFDFVIDLHHNLRTFWIKTLLLKKTSSFPKKNFEKWLLTKRKQKNIHISHIVDRYAETLKPLHISLDNKGLDFFLSEEITKKTQEMLQNASFSAPEKAICVVLGAQHQTKKWISEYFISLLNELKIPAILIGGKQDANEAEIIAKGLSIPYYNAVGKCDLATSAALIQLSGFVLAHDTGMMHIAAAFGKKIFVLWGNTSPEIGFSPYKTEYYNLQVENLECRPCDKIGYQKCPLGHFACMNGLKPNFVAKVIEANL